MPSDAEMMCEVLNAVQNAPESIEIIVSMINHIHPGEPATRPPVDEAGVRDAVELLLARDFVVLESWTDLSRAYVQIASPKGFDASELWVQPTQAGTAWLYENAPADWYSH